MGLSQSNIAERVGVSQAFISQILAGIKSPSWGTAKKLAAATGISQDLWMESKTNYELLKQHFTTTKEATITK